MVRYTEPTSINWSLGFDQVLHYVNDVTNSWASNMILIGIFIITTMGVVAFKKDYFESMAIAGFLTFMVSVFFWIGGFISGTTLVYVIVVTILCFGLLWINNKSTSN